MPMQGLLFFVPILSPVPVRQDSSTRLSVEPTRFTVDLEGKKPIVERARRGTLPEPGTLPGEQHAGDDRGHFNFRNSNFESP